MCNYGCVPLRHFGNIVMKTETTKHADVMTVSVELIRLFLKGQSHLGLQCLLRPICRNT